MPLTAWVGNLSLEMEIQLLSTCQDGEFDILHPVDLVEDIAIGHG